jgi:TonB family protein
MIAVAVTTLAGCGTGRMAHESDSAEAGRYGHIMHNRFYEAWAQPKIVAVKHGKISVPVDVQIDRSGRVISFKLVTPSGNPRIDDSIAVVGETVKQVTPPPLRRLQKQFALRIYFELDVKR